MRGSSSDCIVQTNPLTLALSPRFVVSVLRDSLAGERGQISVAPVTSLYSDGRESSVKMISFRTNLTFRYPRFQRPENNSVSTPMINELPSSTATSFCRLVSGD